MDEQRSIKLYKQTDYSVKKLSTGLEFFNVEFIIAKITKEKITFVIPTLDYSGKVYKVNKQGKRFFITVTGEMEAGIYAVDEDESNIDKIVVYFDDKIGEI